MNKPPAHHFVDLHHKSFGRGRPLIILHGLFGSLENWYTLAKSLAEHYSVYTLDIRNHGKSPHTNDMDYQSMAYDVYMFCKNKQLHNIFLLGHSMGGKVALTILNQYEELIEKIMILDIAPKQYPRGHDELFKAMITLHLDELQLRSEAEKRISLQVPDATVRQFILKNLDRDANGKFIWKMNVDVLYSHYENIQAAVYPDHVVLHEILFVKGQNSTYILPEDEKNILDFYPNALFKTIAGAGHWVHAERPDAMRQVIVDYFGQE